MAKLSGSSTVRRSTTRRTTLHQFLTSHQGRAFFAQVQSSRRKSARLVRLVDQRIPVDDGHPEQLLTLRVALHTACAKLETAEQTVRLLLLANDCVPPQNQRVRNSQQPISHPSQS